MLTNMKNQKRVIAQAFFTIFLVIGGGVIGVSIVPPEIEIVEVERIIEVEKIVEIDVPMEVKPFKTLFELYVWLERNKINENVYIIDDYDCDDYAIDLVRAARKDGYEIFICATDLHMFNMVFINEAWYFIEPQTDEVVYVGTEL